MSQYWMIWRKKVNWVVSQQWPSMIFAFHSLKWSEKPAMIFHFKKSLKELCKTMSYYDISINDCSKFLKISKRKMQRNLLHSFFRQFHRSLLWSMKTKSFNNIWLKKRQEISIQIVFSSCRFFCCKPTLLQGVKRDVATMKDRWWPGGTFTFFEFV